MPPLKLTLEGDTHVNVTRTFKASPEHVYRAHLEPDLIRKWMIGMPGWTMPVCDSDSRPGGTFHYEWDDGEGGGFAISGEFIALEPHSRIEHIERMHMPDPTPDNHIVTTFTPHGPHGEGTLLTMRMTLPDSETRKAMMDMGVADGMEISYGLLDAIEF